MIKVLFVCLGNICRSTMAEAVFKHQAAQLGLSDQFAFDSAGTAAYHIGKDPDYRTQNVLKSKAINYQHKGQQVTKAHFYEYDLMFAMDSDNYDDLLNLKPYDSHCKIELIRKYDEFAYGGLDVPDPYYGSEKDFLLVYHILSTTADKLLPEYKESGRFGELITPENHT